VGNLNDISSFVYLDNNGNLIVKISNNTPQIFKNPLTLLEAEMGLLATSTTKSVNSLFTGKNNFLYSKNMKWILFTSEDVQDIDKDCIHILYNPFYRKEFKDYHAVQSTTALQYYTIYCNIVGNDPYYTCVDNAKCKSDYLGDQEDLVDKVATQASQTIRDNCSCINATCTNFKLYLDRADNFLFDVFDKKNCQVSYTMVICNATIEAGRNINNLQSIVKQNCNANTGGTDNVTKPPTPKPPVPNPPVPNPPTTNPPTTNPPTPDTDDTDIISPTKPLVDPSKKGGTLSATPNNNSLKIKIAIASTVLLLLILLLVYFFADL
jgi:hypothetical protein